MKIKKTLVTFLLLNLIFITNLTFANHRFSESQQSKNSSPRIQKCLKIIQKVPEAVKLIEEVQKEGFVRVKAVDTKLAHKFGAYWDPANRMICVAIDPGVTIGELIGSIIFELHNAKANSKMEKLNHLVFQGKLGKKEYVESMERIEYNNSKEASRLVSVGIEKGIFPSDAFLPTYPTFKEHFRVQQMSGHSRCFERNYDAIKNFGRR